jgi:tetratricopeptide (TPR) repeat protein
MKYLINYDSADAWYLQGKSLFGLEKYDEAIKCYEKAILINKAFSDSWFALGEALERSGSFSEAKKFYNKAFQLRGNQ